MISRDQMYSFKIECIIECKEKLLQMWILTSTKLFDKYTVYLLNTVWKYCLQLQYYDVKRCFEMYLFSKHSLIRYDCCVSIGLLLQNLAGRILTQKTMIQSILYSQLVCFTYIYLSEARTSAKYRNKTGKLLTNTEETFTSRKELRRADQSTCI